MDLIFNLIGLVVGFLVGWINERRHFKSLDEREQAMRDIQLTNLKTYPAPEQVVGSTMVIGQVVIASDYFKSFATMLRNLVGGEMHAAMSLMVRARREAILRMMEEARRYGSTEICNVRLEFSSINQMRGKKGALQVEMLAFGTAIVRRPS